jgi:hypothetical protein
VTVVHVTVPTALREARRSLETLVDCLVQSDWQWHSVRGVWSLNIRLRTAPKSGGAIPPDTAWYLIASSEYPLGYIGIRPAREGGITGTRYHQLHNSPGDASTPWRDGEICVRAPAQAFGRTGYDYEPFEPDERLAWHVARALEWLRRADAGCLVADGDPFELPHFRPDPNEPIVAFCEDVSSFDLWSQIDTDYGYASLRELRGNSQVLLIEEFRDSADDVLARPRWSPVGDGDVVVGLWIRVGTLPVLEGWEAPMTWGQLLEAADMGNGGLLRRAQRLASRLRDAGRHPALIGFPIPRTFGGPAAQIHWQAIRLPILASGSQKANGFRNDKRGRWAYDRLHGLHNRKRITWMRSENWSQGELSTRGHLPDHVRNHRVAILGVGAMGSALAELLVRGGVTELVLIDNDHFQAGNLARHILGMDSVSRSKAQAVAERLKNTTPHASVCAIEEAFPPKDPDACDELAKCDLVFDCTASDDVLAHIGTFHWGQPTNFASVSIGYEARRLFVFTAQGESFPSADCSDEMRPWLERERDRMPHEDLPWEGTGCWNAVFPARADDIWLLTAIALKHVTTAWAQGACMSQLAVYEQCGGDGISAGVRRVDADSTTP